MDLFLIGSLFFLLGGIAAILTGENYKSKIYIVFSAAANILALPAVFNTLLSGNSYIWNYTFSFPIGKVDFVLDPLSAFFALIILIGSFLASCYSAGYMKMYIGKNSQLSAYLFFFGLMSTSMMLVIVVQNALMFLISWELMSIASFFLVTFEHEKNEVRKAGIYYFTSMQIGVAFLIAGFAWISSLSGSLAFNSFHEVFRKYNHLTLFFFLMFFIGFGTKAGYIPMHTWLPRAHPAAPTSISALMSGVMIKTGIYGILRIILLMDIIPVSLAYFVLLIGLVTGIVGIANAISQHDFKKLLAYSSIENIGIVGIAIGLGMLGRAYGNDLIAGFGFLGALLHTFNHFTFKSVLFYGAGVVYSQTHTRNIDMLGGLVKYLPKTSIMFLFATVAISGFPLLNGFVGEFFIYTGLAKSFSIQNIGVSIVAVLGISGLAFIGSMAMITFTKLFGLTFLGMNRSEFHNAPHEKNSLMLFPMSVLTLLMLAVGLLPITIIYLLLKVLPMFSNHFSLNGYFELLSLINSISISLAIFLLFIVVIYSLRKLLISKRSTKKFKTWDCGYQDVTSRMQYTSGSYAHPFMQLISKLVPIEINVEKESALFPKEASLKSSSRDVSEGLIIQPIISALRKFMDLFSWIQSGRMQQYIIYGLIFLLALLIWILGVEL
ncbi:proton-conducting transporter transmembrane domain-containing protein [Melioribacter sp. OK-6-Me]|uniref:proton-conducting transporter transmembrane domain-containing protein n=1 Tax=unclassified Melioribacter TaxID=2627329 RepID=UPI003EDB2B67